MPQLNWNKLDFLEYLEVVPIVDDHSTSYNYQVMQGDLRLLLTVWQYESVVHLSLLRDTTNYIFSFACYVRGKIDYVNDKRGKCLEIVDCVIAPNRFWYLDVGDVFDRNRFPHGLTVKVETRPDIRVVLEPCRSC